MINFEVVGVQYKTQKHCQPLKDIYNKMNVLVIGLEEAKHISTIVVKCSDFHNIVEMWKQLCETAAYFNCKLVCWHHDCQYIAYPDSDSNLVNLWSSYIIEYHLANFGPYAPDRKKSYQVFCDGYTSTARQLNVLYRQIEEVKKKRAELVYDRFASGIEDEIDMKDIDPGTPKVVKKNINAILKMTIGILDKSKEKYLVDFQYKFADDSTYKCGLNARKFSTQDHLYMEWIDYIEELKGNYVKNYEIAAAYINRYLMKKLNMTEEQYKDTYYSYFTDLLKRHD